MGFGTKLQHALKFLPSLFDSDIGNRDEPQFQLLRHNDFTTGQVRRAISSNIAINTALPSTLHVAKSDVFLPTTKEHGGCAYPFVSTSLVEASVTLNGSYGSDELRQFLLSASSDLLPRNTETSKASIPGLLNQ